MLAGLPALSPASLERIADYADGLALSNLYHNFVRGGRTPAMAAGILATPWSMDAVAGMIDLWEELKTGPWHERVAVFSSLKPDEIPHKVQPAMMSLDISCPHCGQVISWVQHKDTRGQTRAGHEGNIRVEWRDGVETVICGACDHPVSVMMPTIPASAKTDGETS